MEHHAERIEIAAIVGFAPALLWRHVAKAAEHRGRLGRQDVLVALGLNLVYGTMRVLKKLIYEMKIEYGLELCTEHRVLLFDPKGTKPAPL